MKTSSANDMELTNQKVDLEMKDLHKKLNLYKRNTELNKQDGKYLWRLLELLAFRSEWERVAELSSQAIVIGIVEDMEIKLYRVWGESLRADFNVEGLQDLGKHLLSRRRESVEYVSLALFCFSYAGKTRTEKTLLQYLWRQEEHSYLTQECLGLSLCNSLDKQARQQGIKQLRKVFKNSACGYFSIRTMLDAAIECNNLEFASGIIENIHKHYNLSPEPFQIAGLLAVSDGKWNEALASFSMNLAVNSKDTNTIILMSRCLEIQGKLVDARTFLQGKAHLFDKKDYEYNVQLGMIEKKLFEATQNVACKNQAILCFENALTAAPHFYMPEIPLVLQLEQLGARKGLDSGKDAESQVQRYWLAELSARTLRSMLEKTSFLVKCPNDADKGDILFFTAHELNSPYKKVVSGFFKIISAPRLDSVLGSVVEVGSPIVFDEEVVINKDNRVINCTTQRGLDNFSNRRKAYFFELSKSLVEEVVSSVDKKHVLSDMLRAG